MVPRTPDAVVHEVPLPEYIERVSETGDVHAGSPLPLGATELGAGTNFALFSRHASRVLLELYDQPEEACPTRVIELDSVHHRTGDIWHVWLAGVGAGQLYGYRVFGPYMPHRGHRFNGHKLLLDPFAGAVTYRADWDFGPSRGYDPGSPMADQSFSEIDSAGAMPKCVVAYNHFDWEDVRAPRRTASETVIYELHVRGFTIHESAGVTHPGTYRGLIEKIPYLVDLGVTAVELMPVFEFNENELARVNPLTGEPLRNYWGYNPAVFLAPESRYCSHGTAGQQRIEFKDMVKAFHRAGIEVILDVVLNHTGEGDHLGPTIGFRGLDNTIYYLLDQNDHRRYRDFTGTGNTLNANHPVVRGFVLEILRRWVVEMRVDGFRFDLASVLGRDSEGNLLPNPPLLESIAEDPILRHVKIIAEAWDLGGAYQVGRFSKRRWADWNGRYRDDVRCFWRGDEGLLGAFASRIAGSADLYEASGKGPENSVNFVTCHDGFTLHDLVSYAHKHNEANGEGNRDGLDENYSANYGCEGETSDVEIQAIRTRQIKNFLLTLLISRGVPMLLAGDEFRRTQGGNNNAYCQDNEVSWLNWRLAEEHAEIHRFTRVMLAFRRAHPVLRRLSFYTAQELRWFSPRGDAPDWRAPTQHCLACMVAGARESEIFMAFNASLNDEVFVLPRPANGGRWRRVADTAAHPPDDVREDDGEELANQREIRLVSRSSVILVAKTSVQ
ncbi:MAG: glycogen debranching protein GlgX [Anaerolineales bacterium]|nr:glycogen debranching protein GlgX [Anaerolineales bacterium]